MIHFFLFTIVSLMCMNEKTTVKSTPGIQMSIYAEITRVDNKDKQL